MFEGGELLDVGAKRSPYLNVGYQWWWEPTFECVKYKKVAAAECWLLLNKLITKRPPHLNVLI